MDLAKLPQGVQNEGKPDSTRAIVIGLASVQFFFEMYLNYRQIRILKRRESPSRDGSWAQAMSKALARVHTSSMSMLQVAALIGLEAIPALWRRAVRIEDMLLKATDRPNLILSHDLDRTAIFLVCCGFVYLLINVPTYIFRTTVMKESVFRGYFRRNHNWVVREIANGYPVTATLFMTAFTIVQFKAYGLKLELSDGCVLKMTAGLVLFVTLYPIFSQPKKKTLTVMEAGALKEGIEELCSAAKFPLENLYITDEQFTEGIQVFGIPKRKHIAIPKNVMEDSSIDGIIGLVAHEMGSWKFTHGPTMLVVGVSYFQLIWILLMSFLTEHACYEAFGFRGEYPVMAALVVFTVAFAPLLTAWMGVWTNYTRRQNCFCADKQAFDLGYVSTLKVSLVKRQSSEAVDVDMLYSIYYDREPTVSERLARLEKLEVERPAKEDGLLSLAEDEKKVRLPSLV